MAEGAGCGVAKLGCKLGAGAMSGLSSSVYTSIFKEENFSAADGVLCGIIGGENSCMGIKHAWLTYYTHAFFGTVRLFICTERLQGKRTVGLDFLLNFY